MQITHYTNLFNPILYPEFLLLFGLTAMLTYIDICNDRNRQNILYILH